MLLILYLIFGALAADTVKSGCSYNKKAKRVTSNHSYRKKKGYSYDPYYKDSYYRNHYEDRP